HDSFHVAGFFDAAGEFEHKRVGPAAVDKTDLRPYAVVAMLNVPELPPGAVKKLKAHVEGGAGLVMFLGDQVKSSHYNGALSKAGLFPAVRLGETYHDPLAAKYPNLAAPKKERARLRQAQPPPKVWFPDLEHPAVNTVGKVRSIFRYLSLDVYWRAELPKDAKTRANALVLVAVTRTGPAKAYKERAEKLADDAVSETKALA